MSENPLPKPKVNSAFMKRKVAGVPMLYLVGGFVVILAVVAFKMKPSPDLAAADEANAANAESDAANPSGSDTVPHLPSGTVIAAPSTPEPAEAPYEDNSTWMRKGVQFLISKGKNPGESQLALQHYLAGNNLTYAEGELRDMVVREYGLPPDGFDAGTTAAKPAPVTSAPTPKPVPVPSTPKPAPKPAPKPVPKPTPPPHRYHVVRPGENLTVIGKKYGKSWQWIYSQPANRKIIGPNPNLIHPNQRLIVG